MRRNPAGSSRRSLASRAIPITLIIMVLIGFTALFSGSSMGIARALRGEAPGSTWFESSRVPDDAAAIRRVLEDQAAAWNRGDIEAFAEGYWKSDATSFSGTQGTLRGWQALVDRYHRAYPDRKAMGTLTFSRLDVNQLCADAALVQGQWHLDREAGPVGGVFSLVLRRLPEGWRIIADHTSVVPESGNASAK